MVERNAGKDRMMCTVAGNRRIAEGMYEMALVSRDIAFRAMPGQFVHVRIPYDGSLLLRRPFSINRVDENDGLFYIVYRQAGRGTELLSRVKPGEVLDVLGPLGNGFVLPQNAGRVLIAGGGCGIAPLRFVLEEWKVSFVSVLGFRNRYAAYHVREFAEKSDRIIIASDDGSIGEEGFVTEFVEREIGRKRPDLMLACGPVPMLVKIQKIANRYNIPCQLSLEQRMGCGIGACLVCSCAVKTSEGWEYKKVCSDGPVFWSHEVILDG